MRDLTKQGIYRIACDMIKADRLITGQETDFFKRLCDQYAIDTHLRVRAMSMTLAEAVSEVRTMPVRQLATFIGEVKTLTRADGACSREEALLLISLILCLNDKEGENYEIASVPWGEIMLDNSHVLYIEDEYNEAMNEYIRQQYTTLSHSLMVGGFEFVYMPKFVESLSHQDASFIKDVIRLLAPDYNENFTDAVARELCGMTSEKLYRELLVGKLGLRIDITEPSLIFRIGHSDVNGKRMANYSVFRLGNENMAHQIQTFVEHLLKFMCQPVVTLENKITTEKAFTYTGFYRTLFDLVTLRKGARSELLVSPYSHKNILTIRTTSADGFQDTPLDLGPKEAAFYLFLISETQQYGGFNIACRNAADISYMEEATKRFESVYFAHCNREQAPDITNPEIRRPMLSKIRKAIESHPTLVERATFMPEFTRHKVIRVHLKSPSQTL